MENEKKYKVTIVLLVIIILLTLVIFFATDTISLNSKEKDIQNDNNALITNNEGEDILKDLYNDATRELYNQTVSYCGEYASGDDTTLTIDGFLYRKSATFNSFVELESYLKGFMTDSLISKSKLYESENINDNYVTSYYEKDGNLYCNSWNKGGNLELEYYFIDESTFTVSNIKKDSFDGIINAVYSDFNNINKTIKSIKVSVVKQNNKWLLNSYKEQ